jgi:hypothetical protein
MSYAEFHLDRVKLKKRIRDFSAGLFRPQFASCYPVVSDEARSIARSSHIFWNRSPAMLFRSYKPPPPLSDFIENFWMYNGYESTHLQSR